MAMQDASNVFHKKQMYNSVITGKENASKDWNCIISMFLIVLITICLKTAICFFLVKTGWQSCSIQEFSGPALELESVGPGFIFSVFGRILFEITEINEVNSVIMSERIGL